MLLLLGERVPAAGIDGELLARELAQAENLSIFALHLGPLVAAYLVVELVAMLVPKWRALRHRWPEGRAKLERVVFALVVAFAGFQAWAIAQLVPSPLLSSLAGDSTDLLFALSVVAGACFLALLATAITRQGLANGVVVLATVAGLERFIREISAWVDSADQTRLMSDGPLLLGAALLLAFALALALRQSSRDCAVAALPSETVEPSPWIPVPASTFIAFTLAASISMLPLVMASNHLPLGQELVHALRAPETRLGAVSVLTLAIAIALAMAFFRADEVARVRRRLLSGAGDSAVGLASWQTLRRALLPTALLLLCLVFVDQSWQLHGLPSLAGLPWLVALALDTFTSARVRQPDLVSVWQERRPYAVPMIQRALAREGVSSTVLGLNLLTSYQIFAPYLAARILVRESDAERAEALLKDRLLGELRLEGSAPAQPIGTQSEPAEPPSTSPAQRARTLLLALAAGATLALYLVALPRPAADSPVLPAALEIVLVDDSLDPLAEPGLSEPPEGVEMYGENVPLGGDEHKVNRYLYLASRTNESFEQIVQRLEPWLRSIRLPADARIVFEEVAPSEPPQGAAAGIAVRSYVVRGPPVIKRLHIARAEAQREHDDMSASVGITLTAAGAQLFGEATRRYVGRRMAILVAGKVVTAPVIKSEISGGYLKITMGKALPDEQLAAAQRLAAALQPLPETP